MFITYFCGVKKKEHLKKDFYENTDRREANYCWRSWNDWF